MNLKLKKLAAAFAIAAAPLGAMAGIATAAAAPASAPTQLTAAPASFQGGMKQDWIKTQCYYWNPVESTGQTCFAERHPGEQPPDWDTTAYTPYYNGRDVIYGPGAVTWNQ